MNDVHIGKASKGPWCMNQEAERTS